MGVNHHQLVIPAPQAPIPFCSAIYNLGPFPVAGPLIPAWLLGLRPLAILASTSAPSWLWPQPSCTAAQCRAQNPVCPGTCCMASCFPLQAQPQCLTAHNNKNHSHQQLRQGASLHALPTTYPVWLASPGAGPPGPTRCSKCLTALGQTVGSGSGAEHISPQATSLLLR